jgi:methylated-DNA-[protein]-cysteine S-methyltransferase
MVDARLMPTTAPVVTAHARVHAAPRVPTEPMRYRYAVTAFGRLLLVGTGDGRLSGLYLAEHVRAPRPGPSWVHDESPFAEARRQLCEYFSGERSEFTLALAPQGTDFQQAVWAALQEIPYGETVSYGEIAAQLGRPGASRAVGAANGANPISIVIPCHRVVAADGGLGGYGWGLDRKSWLLDHEGAVGRGDQPTLFQHA